MWDIAPPITAGSHMSKYVSILLAPFERGESTKANTFDEAVLLDDARAPWPGAAVMDIAKKRRLALRH